MNILITTLSLINPYNFRKDTYTALSTGEQFDGCFTNEAPSKYLVSRLYQDSYTLFDRILVLSTPECAMKIKDTQRWDDMKKQHESGKHDYSGKIRAMSAVCEMTTEEYYQNVIIQYMQSIASESENYRLQQGYSLEDLFEFVNIEAMEGEILDQFRADDADGICGVYLDNTGGSRTTSVIAMFIIKWLETHGYRMKCMAYGNINNNVHEIMDVTDIYGMFNTVVNRHLITEEDVPGRRLNELTEDSIKYNLNKYRSGKREVVRQILKEELTDAYTGEEPFVFFSYAHKDWTAACSFLRPLQEAGIRVWYDEGIDNSTLWNDEIEKKMNACSAAVILLSNRYIKQEYCYKELCWLMERFAGHFEKILFIYLGKTNLGDKEDEVKKYQMLEFQKYELTVFLGKMTKSLKNHAPECCEDH